MSDMDPSDRIRGLFLAERIDDFNFSKAPALVCAKRSTAKKVPGMDTVTVSKWDVVQDEFLDRAKSESKYPRRHLERVKARYDGWFEKRGFATGSVLDIGGGWGLYREWWQPDEGDVFIVHDPGVERFVTGPYKAHHECYERAFSLPMTFVEGMGEVLPYKDDYFATCLIAAALDHCADPRRVLAEAHRCLKPGGRMIIVQGCGEYVRLAKRFVQLLIHPLQLLAKLRARFFGPPSHMHHFDIKPLSAMLKDVGFVQVRGDPVQHVYVFEAFKAAS